MTANRPSPVNQTLIISYYYLPIENAGARPVIKTANYLPEFGYQPVILTTNHYGRLPDDDEKLIFRAGEILGRLKQLYRFFKMKDVPAAQQASQGLLPPGGRLERWKLNYLIPDPKVLWYLPAVRRGRQIVQSRPIRLLYSVSPPETGHLIALNLKQQTGLPWVVDFRDGWLFEPLIPARLSATWRHRLEARLEGQVMARADRVVAVNEVMAADLARRYPEQAAKLSVIPNGYDPADFANLSRPAAPADRFRLVYTGSLSLSRAGTSIEGLLQALQAMQARQAPLLDHLKIEMIGNIAAAERQAIIAAGLAPYFCLSEPVPYRQALQYQLDADVLLLVITPQARGISTSKLFEYLATGRPILALSGPSVAAQLIDELEAGLVVAPDDVAGIQHALQTFYQKWQAGALPAQVRPEVARFDRRELTRQLAHIFDALRSVN